MIKIFLSLIICFECSSIGAITKLSEELYIAKQNDNKDKKTSHLYFVLEKITPQNYKPWKLIAQQWRTIAVNLRDDKDRFFKKSLIDALNRLLEQINSYEHADVWVAYISLKPIDTLYQHQHFDTFNDAVMTMAVTTNPQVPFSFHMGISRNIKSILNPGHFPKNLSTLLHGFAASAMTQFRPDIKYVMTFPLGKMAEIMQKAIPTDGMWVYPYIDGKRNLSSGPVRLQDGTFEVFDKCGKKILTLPNFLKNEQYDWFTRYFSGIYPLAVIDSYTLAKLFIS